MQSTVTRNSKKRQKRQRQPLPVPTSEAGILPTMGTLPTTLDDVNDPQSVKDAID
jgi:hypothetical protein